MSPARKIAAKKTDKKKSAKKKVAKKLHLKGKSAMDSSVMEWRLLGVGSFSGTPDADGNVAFETSDIILRGGEVVGVNIKVQSGMVPGEPHHGIFEVILRLDDAFPKKFNEPVNLIDVDIDIGETAEGDYTDGTPPYVVPLDPSSDVDGKNQYPFEITNPLSGTMFRVKGVLSDYPGSDPISGLVVLAGYS